MTDVTGAADSRLCIAQALRPVQSLCIALDTAASSPAIAMLVYCASVSGSMLLRLTSTTRYIKLVLCGRRSCTVLLSMLTCHRSLEGPAGSGRDGQQQHACKSQVCSTELHCALPRGWRRVLSLNASRTNRVSDVLSGVARTSLIFSY